MQDKQKYKFLKQLRYKNLTNWSVKHNFNSEGFNNKYPLIKIKDLVRLVRNEISLQENVEYKQITIRLYNKGVVLRDIKKGQDIKTKKQFLVNSGHFVFSKIDARNGAFGIVPDELDNSVTTNSFSVYEVNKDKINTEFLRLLTSTKQFIEICENNSTGTTGRRNITDELFENIEIPLPNLDAQNKIVTDYNNLIHQAEQQEQEIIKFENEIVIYLQTELGIETSKTDSKKGLQFVRFKNLTQWGIDKLLNLTAITKTKYSAVPISEICKISSGGTPSREKKEYYENGNILWVKTTEVVNDIILDTEEKITELGLKNSSAKLYPAGSLIIAMYGQGLTRGRTAKLGVPATTNQACGVLYNIDNSVVDTDFLWIYLQNEYERLRELASGNNQPNLNAQMIADYKIYLPPLPEQRKILKTVEKLKSKISNLRQEIEISRKLAKENFEQALFKQ